MIGKHIYPPKLNMVMMKRLMMFLNSLRNTETNPNIVDVTHSPADWEDFWYNEDV
tara:strand:- start:165 stop:329 length:165 start_codon:yes stop_codon:yes gene_type:complete